MGRVKTKLNSDLSHFYLFLKITSSREVEGGGWIEIDVVSIHKSYDKFLLGKVSASGGLLFKGSTTMRCGQSQKKCKNSRSTTVRKRKGWSSAYPAGWSSMGSKWWATRLSVAATTWPENSAMTRGSLCGRFTRARRNGKPARSKGRGINKNQKDNIVYSVYRERTVETAVQKWRKVTKLCV